MKISKITAVSDPSPLMTLAKLGVPYRVFSIYIADRNEDRRCTYRNDDGVIKESVRNLTIGRRFSKEERNIVKDVLWGLSG